MSISNKMAKLYSRRLDKCVEDGVYYWQTVGLDWHGGPITEVDSNDIFVQCEFHGKECGTTCNDDFFLEQLRDQRHELFEAVKPNDAKDAYRYLTSIIRNSPPDEADFAQRCATAFERDLPIDMLSFQGDNGRRPKAASRLENPIIVVHTGDDRYIIVDGNHRYLQHKQMGKATIKGIVVDYPQLKKNRVHKGYLTNFAEGVVHEDVGMSANFAAHAPENALSMNGVPLEQKRHEGDEWDRAYAELKSLSEALQQLTFELMS